MTTPTTPTEQDLLRFPGHVPGVLRRGSPIFERGEPGLYAGPSRMGHGSHDVYLTCLRRVGAVPIGILSLDLTDATGRHHLDLWLEAKGVACCSDFGTGGFQLSPGWSSGETREAWPAHVYLGDGMYALAGPAQAPETDDLMQVPALATLDPNNPRLLPDGSRLVDALALSLVARHVAGLETS